MAIEYNLELSSNQNLSATAEACEKLLKIKPKLNEYGVYLFESGFGTTYVSSDQEKEEELREKYDLSLNISLGFRLFSGLENEKKMMTFVIQFLSVFDNDCVFEFDDDSLIFKRVSGEIYINIGFDDGTNFPMKMIDDIKTPNKD